ncbi:hypothetical protein ACH42_08465 [Endozoicomonas sp. (ex Bugula neritina AB1)]|nr:hypothetical protein ACH42_08465 [Endozoicomonas sp. (ex Bugula neritina AB1)]
MTTVNRTAKQTMQFGGNMQNRYIEQSLSKATRAVNMLQKEGFSIEQLELGRGGKPRIKISFHPRCSILGVPSSYSQGNNGIHYETYLVQYEGCQVSWIRK